MATTSTKWTTREVAARMAELFRENKWAQIQDELYAEDAESIESNGGPGLQSVTGIDAIRQKGKEFKDQVEEVHDGWISEPIVAGNFISVAMGMEVTLKGAGRFRLDEIAVYEVKDGKIIREQFFF